jgi:murein DD-endopeptidase MepM/ murein hydrolase activator NlpD
MSGSGVNQGCAICGDIPFDAERRVLVVGKRREVYCSQACLRTGVRKLKIARRKARLRGAAALLSLALVAGGVGWGRHWLRHHHRRQPAPLATPAPIAPPAAPEEPPFGPHWPPTDDEWRQEFAHAAWVDPLPGPERRRPASCKQLFAPEAAHARCREAGRCGVDLGGELWGEHVYAALDGVVERLQRSDGAPGGLSVRIAHWGGAVFTQYFHLAAIPSRITVGMRVEAGEVIGLVGDSGGAPRPHLHFALSVRPSSALPEVYWDPAPLMAEWPLHTPGRGSVAGLVSIEAPPERIAGFPSPQHRAAVRRAH